MVAAETTTNDSNSTINHNNAAAAATGFGLEDFTMQGFEHCNKESKTAMRRRQNLMNILIDQTVLTETNKREQSHGSDEKRCS